MNLLGIICQCIILKKPYPEYKFLNVIIVIAITNLFGNSSSKENQ